MQVPPQGAPGAGAVHKHHHGHGHHKKAEEQGQQPLIPPASGNGTPPPNPLSFSASA